MKEGLFVKVSRLRKRYTKYLQFLTTICIIMGGKDVTTSQEKQRASEEDSFT